MPSGLHPGLAWPPRDLFLALPMSMVPEQQRLTPAERANLVAYLDEELSAPEAEVIATKLTHSPTARREAELLQKTWDLLDQLPMPRAPESLTERTITEARTLAARGDQFGSALAQTLARIGRDARWVGIAAVVGVLAFAGTRWLWPNPTERLTRDLPIAEYLDEYRDVGTLDFLQELANSQAFGNDRGE